VVLFCHVTTRIEGRKNEGLLGEVGGQAFPHLVALDAEGKPLGQPPGRKVSDFKLLMEYLDLKPKAEKGDEVAKVEYFIRALMMGDFKEVEAAKTHLSTLKNVSKEQKGRIDGLFIDLEVQELLKPLNDNKDQGKVKELVQAAGKSLLEMHKKGRVPTMDNTFGSFYSLILANAEAEKNIPVFEEALKLLEQRFPDGNPRFFAAKKKILEEMKAEKESK
jgi:hypothetical protein